MPAEAHADFYTITHEMIERKNKHFAEYDRLILDFELVDRAEVERCHRQLAAEAIAERYGVQVTHL